jgi:hypothetical protein
VLVAYPKSRSSSSCCWLESWLSLRFFELCWELFIYLLKYYEQPKALSAILDHAFLQLIIEGLMSTH